MDTVLKPVKGTNRRGGKKGQRRAGRSRRPALHRTGQQCNVKNCRNLLASRKFDTTLGVYVAPAPVALARAAERVR